MVGPGRRRKRPTTRGGEFPRTAALDRGRASSRTRWSAGLGGASAPLTGPQPVWGRGQGPADRSGMLRPGRRSRRHRHRRPALCPADRGPDSGRSPTPPRPGRRAPTPTASDSPNACALRRPVHNYSRWTCSLASRVVVSAGYLSKAQQLIPSEKDPRKCSGRWVKHNC